MSGNQTLSSFAKIMQSFILMQNLQNLYWIEGGDIFGALFFFQKSVLFGQYRMLP